jgi:hypothetical protein
MLVYVRPTSEALLSARVPSIIYVFSRAADEAAPNCAQHSHPPNPERAGTRSCPTRAHSDRARSASKERAPRPLLTFLLLNRRE